MGSFRAQPVQKMNAKKRRRCTTAHIRIHFMLQFLHKTLYCMAALAIFLCVNLLYVCLVGSACVCASCLYVCLFFISKRRTIQKCVITTMSSQLKFHRKAITSAEFFLLVVCNYREKILYTTNYPKKIPRFYFNTHKSFTWHGKNGDKTHRARSNNGRRATKMFHMHLWQNNDLLSMIWNRMMYLATYSTRINDMGIIHCLVVITLTGIILNNTNEWTFKKLKIV